MAERTAWRDKQGDIWTEGDDGLMWTPETRPFPREHVERKWGPLVEVPYPGYLTTPAEPSADQQGADHG
jgi:hypothetical protein